jgi:hypothetical protein
MNNVLQFPNSPDNDRKPSQKDEAARAKNTGAARAEQIQRLRKALGDKDQPGPKLLARGQKAPSADQLTVARALHGLLQRIENDHRISKAKVMREAGIGEEGDSTKHLSQYAIPPGKTTSRLCIKARPYEKLAKAAARCARLDEGDVLMEVFGKASFWHSMGAREAAEEFEELARRLRYVMDAVARKHDLGAFFRDVKKCGGVIIPSFDSGSREQVMGRLLTPDEIEVKFYFGDFGGIYGGPQRWPIEFYQLSYEATDGNGDHVPVYPSLVLGAWRFKPFRVDISAQMTDANGSLHPTSKTVEGQSTIELRLCIVPWGKSMEATPALRVQWTVAQVEAEVGDTSSCGPAQLLHFQYMPLLKRGRSKLVGHSIAGDHDVDCEAFVESDTLPNPFREYFGDLEPVTSEMVDMDGADGVRFLPLNGRVCEDWLELRISENHYDPMQQRLADRIQGKNLADWSSLGDTPSMEFSFGTLADMIDRCLCDASKGLDVQFENQAEFLRRTYNEHRSLARRERAEGWDRVKKRWEAFSSASPDGLTD